MFLKISQNSQENTSARVPFLIKLQTSGLKLYFKNRLLHRCFPVNFVKFSWTSFLQSTFEWLLLGFPCNFTKMGQCQQCLENNKYSLSSNKYFYLETLTLEVPFRYIISFSAAQTFSVCLHWLTLFTTRSRQQSRGVLQKKVFLKIS